MYKNILVGLDGSEHGLQAMERAVNIAKLAKSRLYLLTVTRPYKISGELRRYLESENLLGEPKYVLDDVTNRIISQAKDIANKAGLSDVHTDVREGRPARSIVEYAQSHRIELIVLGSRGLGEVDSKLLGSVSQKVSILCECDVLIVKR